MLSPLLKSTLDRELTWRERELALTKAQLLSDVDDDVRFGCSYRAFVAITYAHYEAFTKLVVAQSVSDIAASGTLPSKCAPTLQLALIVPRARRKLEQSANPELLAALQPGSLFLDSVRFPSDEEFLAISNLNVPNLEKLLCCAGLNWAEFSNYKRHIGRLVDLRHRCAHGERITFDSSKTNFETATDAFALQAQIVSFLHHVSVEIVDLFEQRRYVAI